MYTVYESEDHVVVTVMMVGNNTLIDVPVIFSTIDDWYQKVPEIIIIEERVKCEGRAKIYRARHSREILARR